MAAQVRLALAGSFDGTGGNGGGGVVMMGELLWWDSDRRTGLIRSGDIDVFVDWGPVHDFGCPKLSRGDVIKFVARTVSPTIALLRYILRIEPARATVESDAPAEEIDAETQIQERAAAFMRWRQRTMFVPHASALPVDEGGTPVPPRAAPPAVANDAYVSPIATLVRTFAARLGFLSQRNP